MSRGRKKELSLGNRLMLSLYVFLVSVLILFAAAVWGIGYMAADKVLSPVSGEETITNTLEWLGMTEEEAEKQLAEYSVKKLSVGTGKKAIPAWYLENAYGQNRLVVMVHDTGMDHRQMIAYTELFWDMGYSMVLYDQRGSGINENKGITAGILEQGDLDAVISTVRETIDPEIIGVWGTGAGANTALLYGEHDKELSFLILDSVGRSFEEVVNTEIQEGRLPFPESIERFCTDWYFRLWGGISSVRAGDLYEAAVSCKVPVLMVHSSMDKRVSMEEAERIFSAFPEECEAELFRVLYSAAGEAYIDEPFSYQTAVADFLDKIL